MKLIWKRINRMHVKADTKNLLFLWSLILLSATIGALAYIAIGRWFLPGGAWFAGFAGYPAMFVGCFGGIVYLFNHEFITENA